MEKSGEKATHSRNRKPRKNIVNFPKASQADSSKPSPPPAAPEMSIPPPADGLASSERAVIKFLNRYKVGKRGYEMSAKIGDIVYRAIGGRQRAI